MTYWFMRMKQGPKGEDFAKELWQQALVGVLFGTWRIEHVLDQEGKPDPNALTTEAIEKQCSQPEGIDNGRDFNDEFLRAPRAFLLDVTAGDRIVVVFDEAIHVGTVGTEYRPDPNPPRGGYEEHFKCRPLHNQKSFALADLPASYRLIVGTGRSAVQRINRYENLIRLLDDSASLEGFQRTLENTTTPEFLGLLSAEQWEVLCSEYLRHQVGLRLLLLAVGGTLKDIDIYGVDQDGCRVLAQCKNDPEPWNRQRLVEWMSKLARSPEDSLYFFCRGGVEGGSDGLGCHVVDGEDISKWLDDDPIYRQYLKML